MAERRVLVCGAGLMGHGIGQVLAAAGHAVALLNPLRTHRFAEVDLDRTKTDAIDALGIARFAAQKRPVTTPVPDALTEELRELVQLRQRLMQDFGDRVRQLHRLVDLGFPEFTRYVKSLDSELASSILHDYPTAEAFHHISVKRLANLRYDGRHKLLIAVHSVARNRKPFVSRLPTPQPT